MVDVSKLTPAQRQYRELKKQCSDCILFFRMGDFYETFYEDAKICSKVLDITLTSRDRNSENPVPMAGVPYHSAEKYIQRLVQSGYKVAIGEQIGDVKPGQIVKRDIVSIITPGTFIDEKNAADFNYIGALVSVDGVYHMAWGDFSIGEYFTRSSDSIDNIYKLADKLNITEIVLDMDIQNRSEISENLKKTGIFVSMYDIPFDPEILVKQVMGVQKLESYGEALVGPRLSSISLLFGYLKDTQKSSLRNVSRISYDGDGYKVGLDEISVKNLEILKSSYEGSKRHSLIGVIDQTNSYMGGRLLSSLIINPIKDLEELEYRYGGIQRFHDNSSLCDDIITLIKQLGDIPRLITTLIYKKNSPFIFNRLKHTLRTVFTNEFFLEELKYFGLEESIVSKISEFYQSVENSLKDEGFTEELDYIKDGFDAQIDELRKIAYHSDDLLIEYQQFLINYTGLANIKIRYVSNQGYFIELTRKDVENFEAKSDRQDDKKDFMRRQTLKSAERYVTTYLEEVQVKILTSKDKLQKLEKEILEKLKVMLESLNNEMFSLSDKIAWIDVFSSFGNFARLKGYVRPHLFMPGMMPGKSKDELLIRGGKHPIIDEFLPVDEQFVPNDLMMDPKENIHIITGPNMGGKSTFLRQNAIIVLMAHCGLWVSASSADIPLMDGIYARVGSGDVLAKNQSTFMTEMIEVSNILNNATANSFIVLDELGRGTSTYDGVALAKAIVEYISNNISAKTLFATHYHELISLEGKMKGVVNYSVSVHETDKSVVFLKKIVKGGVDKSYGIDVAKLAGLPNSIILKSRDYLRSLESEKNGKVIKMSSLFEGLGGTDVQVGKGKKGTHVANGFGHAGTDGKIGSQLNGGTGPGTSSQDKISLQKYDKIKSILDQLNIDDTTPVKAFDLLGTIKAIADEE